jgi:hypothetical protein
LISPDAGMRPLRAGTEPGTAPSLRRLIKPIIARRPLLISTFNFNAKKSDEWKAKKLQAEINNGRLAMIGLMSLLSEGAVPGSVPALKGLIPASGEINVMSPVDFTKPLFG